MQFIFGELERERERERNELLKEERNEARRSEDVEWNWNNGRIRRQPSLFNGLWVVA